MESSRSWNKIDTLIPKWLNQHAKKEFLQMTPVQAATIPILCGNKDLVVQAITGSGKTLAFLIPLFARLSKIDPLPQSHVGAIVICPTRLLALQIFNVAKSWLQDAIDHDSDSLNSNDKDKKDDSYSDNDNDSINENIVEHENLTIQLLTGNDKQSLQEDLHIFKKNDNKILIATPGKLLKFISSPAVKLSDLDLLVLDEADQLLDLGFFQVITDILKQLPKQRRSALFSATMKDSLDNLITLGLRNPVKIVVNTSDSSIDGSTPSLIDKRYAILNYREKLPGMLHLLHNSNFKKAIVFFPTCDCVSYFYNLIEKFDSQSNINYYSIHGKLSTSIRNKVLKKFSNSLTKEDGDDEMKTVLFSTDVAARGLDIPNVDLIINISPPKDISLYLHRSGRSGRNGNSGVSILFLTPGIEEEYLNILEVKKIFLNKIESSSLINEKETLKFEKFMNKWILENKLHHKKAVVAFVSFVQFYSKLLMGSVFRTSALNYIDLAKSYGLLRLPRMPELRKSNISVEIPKDGWLIDDIKIRNLISNETEDSNLQVKPSHQKGDSKYEVRNNSSWSKSNNKKDKKAERYNRKREHENAERRELLNHLDEDDDDEIEKDWKDLVFEKRKKKAKTEKAFDV